jgi:hypothetical protein
MGKKASSIERSCLPNYNLRPEYLALKRLREQVEREEELLRTVVITREQRPPNGDPQSAPTRS